MAKEFDRVKFSIPDAPGTGTVTVGTRSDSSFFLPTEQGAVDGDQVYYVIQKSNKDTEVGVGTVASSATEVTRDLVMSSIISGTAGTSKINIDASAFMAFVTPAYALKSLRVVRTVTGATDTFADNDGMGQVTYNRATAIAAALPQAGASGKFLSAWFTFVSNIGAGTVTITPTTSTINGATTLVLPQNLGAMIVSDGTNYRATFLPVTKPLLAANNLSDVANAATARTNLGASTVGAAVFTAADAAAGRTSLGASTIGAALFTATDAATAGAALGLLDADRQNALLDRIYQSKLLTGHRRVINSFADGYRGIDGVNAGLSSGYAVTTASGFVAPVGSVAATTTINTGGATTTGSSLMIVDRTTAVLNGATISKIGVYSVAAKTVVAKIVRRNSAGNYDIVVSQSYSHPGAGFADVTLTTPYVVPSTGTFYLGAFIASGGNLTDGNLTRSFATTDVTGTGQTLSEDAGIGAAFGTRYATGFLNMTVVTTSLTSDVNVSNGRVLIEYDNTANPTPGTDWTVEVTCNGGTNWSPATLSVISGQGQSGRAVAETADTACTAGNTFAARIKTLTNKSVPIYGTSITVH